MPQRPTRPAQDGPASSESARVTAMRGIRPEALASESTETRQVLMQRVISLTGAPETPKPKLADLDLSRTVHEWSTRQPQLSVKPPEEAQWATHSSISLEICESTQLSHRILHASIEDAVTQQYDPGASTQASTLGSSTSDLASLDRALESAGVLEDQEFGAITNFRQPSFSVPESTPAPAPAPAPLQPRMLLVPASVVWAVLAVFALCALALTVLVVVYLVR